jgi:carboxyl-terminal processing protease
MQGLVVDLRFNPGGLLTSAVDVADLFIAEGLIVATDGRNTERKEWKAQQRGTLTDVPLAVLVNQFSASASEVTAAALQDHGRAVIVGERTWGKGSVQNVVELENGQGALKLTIVQVAKTFTASSGTLRTTPGA